MRLTVPGSVNKYGQCSDNRTSPCRRQLEAPDVRHRRTSDSENNNNNDHHLHTDAVPRHHVVPSPHRGKPQAAAAAGLQPPVTAETSILTKRSKRLANPAYPQQANSSPDPDGVFPRSPDCRMELRVDDCVDRPRSCDDALVRTKPILSRHPCHDCSTENVRTFVDGVELRRGCGYVVGGRGGYSTEALFDMQAQDSAEAAGRKSVRFSPVVRVCDPTSTITLCQLRHQSASAPAALGGSGGGGCSLPAMSSGGCIGSGPRSAVAGDRRDGGGCDLPAVVERYMVRQPPYFDDTLSPPCSDNVHRFPPLRRRRT